MNRKELRAQMIRMGKSTDELCAAIGISRSAWFRKLSGESEFTQGEITGLRSELSLDDRMTGVIFFNGTVS